MIKTTGLEFWKFYNDGEIWKDVMCHDETVVRVNGVVVEDFKVEYIPLDCMDVQIDGGVVYFTLDGDKSIGFESFFKKWRKAQTIKTVVIQFDVKDEARVMEAIKAAGGRAA